MPLLSVLADAAPPIASDPASAQSVGWVVLSIAAAAAALERVLALVKGLRSMQAPSPGTASADRVKALEDRLHTVEIQIATHMGGIDSKFASINQTLTNLQTDWSYQIGKLDGRNEMHG
jgi:hypothetical protein